MEAAVRDIVEKSLEKARVHDKAGNMGKAYAYYTAVAELSPARRSEIEEAFTDVLCGWGMQLILTNRFKDLSLCYERSLDIYPKNTRMLNNFAAHLLRNNEPVKAIRYLKRALEIDPTFLPAERNLQNAYSMAVSRWHFTMLNDKRRNVAFEKAIRKRVLQGYDTVLDIGAGTGLLSLYALNAGAKEVYACECSTIMVDIAKKVFENNNAKSIKLIPKLSTDLAVPHDIPNRVKLIVTETFDAGLFGEFVIPSMIDAHSRILDTNGIIIPLSATLYITSVECEYMRHRTSVVFQKIQDCCSLQFNDMAVLPDDEYYDTENLENVKINYVTEPQKLLTVNFNNLEELHRFNKDGIKAMMDAKCRYDGLIDGLVSWFQLHLDEEITLDSSEGKSCWQLAVFPSMPTICRQGDILTIKAEMSENGLKCSYISDSSHCENKHKSLYRLPREIIMFLNDVNYIKLLSEFSKSHETRIIKTVLDMSPFPIYGLLLLKYHKYCEALYYQTENTVLRSFIEQIANDNGVKDKVHFVSNYSEIDCMLDSILLHNFDTKGELKDWSEDNSREFFCSLLNPNGILIPEKIFLVGQLVFSEELPKMVFVNDANLQSTNVDGFLPKQVYRVSDSNQEEPNMDDKFEQKGIYTIAKYINEFKISQIFDLNSSLYLYKPSSDVYKLIQINEIETSESIVNFKNVNQREKNLLPNTLICWYKIVLTQDYMYETKHSESFMNHTAVVLQDELKRVIMQDKEIKIKVCQSKGFIKITVLEH